MTNDIRHIVFDLGGVLIDWNPRYLYRKIFDTEEEIDYFLSKVCDMDWNEAQDAGRPFEEGIVEKVKEFPEYEMAVRAYFDRWTEMLNGVIEGSRDILGKLIKKGSHNLYAITNWSYETYPIAQKLYPFLSCFQDVVVSGMEKVRKPEPGIFEILIQRNLIQRRHCLFIDDNLRNVKAAREFGMKAIHFTDSKNLQMQLEIREIL